MQPPRRTALGFAAAAALAAAGLALGAEPQPAPARQYVRVLTPLLDAADKPIGGLWPGAALEVVGRTGERADVVVRGWTDTLDPSMLVASPEHPITEMSGLEPGAPDGAQRRVAGETYVARTVRGRVAASALTDTPAAIWAGADGLYARVCARCHVLPQPTVHSSIEWSALMRTQARNAGLSPAQEALLTTYLQTRSGR